MASRGVAYPKLLHKNLPYFLRRLSSAPSPITAAVSPLSFGGSKTHHPEDPVTFTTDPISTTVPPPDYAHPGDQIINFHDIKGLFSTVSTPKLFKSWATLQMTSIEPLVDVGLWVLSSRLVETPVIKQVILGAIKHTFYDHFCAGEDLEEAGRSITRLWEAGLRGMLDYGLEHATDNESCDRNMNEFIKTAEYTKSLPPSSASFVVVKITAICPPSLLRRVSDLLRWEYKNTGYHLPWKRDCLPVFADSSPFYHTAQKPQPLTPEEEQNLQLSHERLFKICEKCVEYNIPLLIDAEDTALQPAIDYLTYSSALLYRRGDDDEPLLFGTIQAYLKDSKERLVKAKKAADKVGVPMGFKLVRGAYMSSERQLAASLGVESPIQNSIQATHDSYNECTSFLLEEVARGSGAAVLATHNIESGKLAAVKATDLGIDKNSERLQFAQLYGMAETLSFGLRNAGFQVSKYLPFGPVDQIMPYLLRRAEENRGLLSSSFLDRQLMSKELARRLKFPTP
ncbi:OLC1v1009911C1 [Oldenlandia corymbosa var. corymbosa]|uniref:Proline dehydrogenase n=1 Tax=Oldenlandia corymbosa var. corymbosa TaxID=529605 RepID=A0AAV1DTB0_OLDCO|nr:OLC1v1009911C1 [Oldenlandia corymbosa var. corymbosa]